MRTGLFVLSCVLTIASTVLSQLGNRPKPWELQTWGGESEPEKQFARKQFRFNWLGFAALLGALAAQCALL